MLVSQDQRSQEKVLNATFVITSFQSTHNFSITGKGIMNMPCHYAENILMVHAFTPMKIVGLSILKPVMEIKIMEIKTVNMKKLTKKLFNNFLK